MNEYNLINENRNDVYRYVDLFSTVSPKEILEVLEELRDTFYNRLTEEEKKWFKEYGNRKVSHLEKKLIGDENTSICT